MPQVTGWIVGTLRARWRWAVVVLSTAALATVPAVVASLPVSVDGPGPMELLARIGRSNAVPYQGTVDAVGRFGLPDLGEFGEAVTLLGDPNRLRVWFGGPDRYRVDLLSTFGETGTHVTPEGEWRWDSERRQAVADDVPSGWRLPRAFDLTPPELGRRLAAVAQPGDSVAAAPAHRVAGRSVPGIRLRPAPGTRTTVDQIALWADPETGLVLRAEVTAVGATRPTAASAFRDLVIGRVDAGPLAWRPAAGVRVRTSARFDPIAAALLLPVPLPDMLDEAERAGPATGAAGLYGAGFDAVVAIGVDRRFVPRGFDAALPASDRPWGGRARVLDLGMVTLMAIDVGPRTYVLAGAVPVEELDRRAATIVGWAR